MKTSSFILDGPKAVIFDFDGTLASLSVDFEAMRSGVLDRIRSYGLPAQIFEGLFVLEMVRAAEQALSRSNPGRAQDFRNGALDFIRSVELDGAGKGAVFDGVPELLSRLRNTGLSTAVVTRNCRDAVTAVYPRITEDTDVVLTRDDVRRVKPHPRHIREALERLGQEPGKAIMVGDHPMDIAAGKAAGTRAAGVLTGSSSREALTAAGSDVVFDRVTDLLP